MSAALDVEWDHPEPFFVTVTATEAEVDSYGHVNNAVYLKWLERCAWAHSASVGLPEATCLALRRGMAVRSMRLEFLAPAHAGDEVLVGNWISANDLRLRATRRFQIIAPAKRKTLLRGEIDYVCLNLDSGRPARMPPAFVAVYAVMIREGGET
jgi:acyl-CoA thioester hydrolase